MSFKTADAGNGKYCH